MRKVAGFALAWLLAAVLALAVAWQGVGIMTRQVTAQRPAPLSAAQLQTRDVQGQPATANSTTPSTDGSSGGGPRTTVGTARPGTPASTTIPSSQTHSTTTTTAATTGNGGPGTRSTTTVVAASETRTYNLVGGSTALKFSPTGVTVQWATPNPGFSVQVDTENGNGVRVQFESDAHRSRLDAWWDAGPQDQVREDNH